MSISTNARILTTILLLSLFLVINGCKKEEDAVSGCTDPESSNYNPDATVDDGSCAYNQYCNVPAEFHDLAYSQKGDNVLKYTVNFKTNEAADVRLVAISAGDSVITGWTESGTTHQIVLIGLRSDTHYKVKIEVQGSDCIKVSDEEFEITTGSLPAADIKNFEVNAGSAGARSGFALCNIMDISKWVGAITTFYQPYIVMVDNEGYIVWYHYYGDLRPVSFSFTPHNTVLAFVVSTDLSQQSIMEVNLAGDVLLDLPVASTGVEGIIHHEIEMDELGDITVLSTEQHFVDRTSVGGTANKNLICDKLYKINNQGNVLWEWSTFGVFDTLELIGKMGFYDFIYGADAEDWLHSNAFVYDKDGHIIISIADHNFLAKINKDNGSLIWTLGENGSLNTAPEMQTYGQHHISLLPNGNFMLFDNGDDHLRPYSRVIEFKVNESNASADLVWNADLPSGNSSDFGGSAIKLSNDDILVASSFAYNKLFELNPNGQVIWGLNTKGLTMYRAYHVTSLFQAPVIL